MRSRHAMALDGALQDRESGPRAPIQTLYMKPSSNPAFKKKYPSHVTVLAEAKSDWHPTDLLNRRSGKTWPSPKELLVRLCGATLQGEWCIQQRSSSENKTVWEIRISQASDIEILRNVIGHDRLKPVDQPGALACYGFEYRKADYANWGSILRTF
ncbi:hypothetical protein [Denitrobaculum tricleocarpae]|uniref:Uncharacterized protein n=1 Tax=Denitrobaculum tricleocarpae TaxID=2591009 RepID=A0A545TR86_9PROT|nr:hypothetical protein [Denitrobaculum tricleocarpae]TQV79726.1 hypothetical protein FKG95_13545 [Denitrobaculum tricleocarpae]